METIYKYELEVKDFQSIEMPKGAEILSVQSQAGIICIWAKVDTESTKRKRSFEIYGTGQEIIEKNINQRKYLATIQLMGGRLVYHIFEYLGV